MSTKPNHAEAILRKLRPSLALYAGDTPAPFGETLLGDFDLTPEEFTYLTNLLGDETP